jgi:methylphosphotriester-DNA--protein-cysteine methyltransferase
MVVINARASRRDPGRRSQCCAAAAPSDRRLFCSLRFDDPRNAVRLDPAIWRVADRRVSIEEAGCLLGFAGTRGFRRVFERWTGTSPRVRRRWSAALRGWAILGRWTKCGHRVRAPASCSG